MTVIEAITSTKRDRAMKKIYVISYDFNGPSERYQSLFDELTEFENWWHFMFGTWLVATDLNAQGIYQKLRPHLDDKINLLVLEAGNDASGTLPKIAWDWIKEHREKNGVGTRPMSPAQLEPSPLVSS